MYMCICVYMYMCVCKYKLNANADSVFLSKVIGSADLRLEDIEEKCFLKSSEYCMAIREFPYVGRWKRRCA